MTSPPRRATPAISSRLIVAVLLAAALTPFLRTLAFGYVMDDTTAILGNADLDGSGALWRVWTHPYGGAGSPYFGLYRPLTMALFAVVWNVGGHWPLWFHVLAIAMHAGATILLWLVLERALGRAPAMLAALWFAVHPVHVEAVANIANSSEVLVAIWTCLLALYLMRVRDSRAPASWKEAVVAGVSFLAAFLSKESGAVAPVLAALCVWGWGSGMAVEEGRTVARWWRVIIAWLVAAIIVIAARAVVLGGPVTGEPIAAAGIGNLSSSRRVSAMLALGPRILELLVWPVGLNPHYGPTTFPQPGSITGLALASLATLALAVAVATWLMHRGDRRPLVALGWLVIAFLPASNILVPTGQILAERTLYVPSMGMAMLIGVVLDAIRVRALAEPRWRITWSTAVLLAGAVAAALFIRTASWTNVWRNHPTLFARMIAADSAGYRGYWLSGLEARRVGQTRDALALLGRAYDLYPTDRGLMMDYAEMLLRSGDPKRAAFVAEGLVSPASRVDPREVELYLSTIGAAFGPDSLRAERQRLARDRVMTTTR